MDDVEAHELDFSKASVTDLDQALAHLGYKNYTLKFMTETWSERFVRLLHPMLPILMLVGLGALYTEIKAPGFGIFGVVGILCLALVFLNQYLVGAGPLHGTAAAAHRHAAHCRGGAGAARFRYGRHCRYSGAVRRAGAVFSGICPAGSGNALGGTADDPEPGPGGGIVCRGSDHFTGHGPVCSARGVKSDQRAVSECYPGGRPGGIG